MKLKNIIYVVLMMTFSSCSLNSDSNTPQVVRNEWHLRNVSGGLEGVNNDLGFNTVIWIFNESSSSLKIENNNTNASIEDGLDSGTYSYSLDEDGNNIFLTIDDYEMGSLTISTNQLIINQNLTSNGTAADGFIYTFRLVEIIE
ncbi:hypothetical protein [Yeosuana sp.]|uniref:hypothetical protein n=1 Tax=Yeosuana sp. TaxID=2529388 RepID=UPI004055327F